MKICQFNYANALINENYISRLSKSLNFFLSSKFDTITKTNVFHQNEILHEKMALIAKSTINPKLKKTHTIFLMLKKLHYMVMNDSTFFMCKTLIVRKHTFIYIYIYILHEHVSKNKVLLLGCKLVQDFAASIQYLLWDAKSDFLIGIQWLMLDLLPSLTLDSPITRFPIPQQLEQEIFHEVLKK